MRLNRTIITALSALLVLSGAGAGCVSAYKQSVGSEASPTFHRVFLTDFNIAWESVLVALKSSSLDVSNREGGFVRTKWAENTAEKNFTDSFGTADSYLKAQYRFRVTVSKGFYNGKQSVKVSVQKDQLVQRDVLEGWRPVESDEVDENTLLYRIGRIIHVRGELAKIEEERVKKELENVEF